MALNKLQLVVFGILFLLVLATASYSATLVNPIVNEDGITMNYNCQGYSPITPRLNLGTGVQQANIPNDKCSIHINLYQGENGPRLLNSYYPSYSSCETEDISSYGGGYGFTGNKLDYCKDGEGILEVAGVFHNTQKCTSAIMPVIYDSTQYFCENCNNNGIWSQDWANLGDPNPCCSGATPTDIAAYSSEFPRPDPNGQSNLIGSSCTGTPPESNTDTCPGDVDNPYTPPPNTDIDCTDWVKTSQTCLISTCGPCGPSEIPDCGGGLCGASATAPVYNLYVVQGVNTNIRPPCDSDTVNKYYCNGDTEILCYDDFRDQENRRMRRYVLCRKAIPDEPDKLDQWCLSCAAGDNAPSNGLHSQRMFNQGSYSATPDNYRYQMVNSSGDEYIATSDEDVVTQMGNGYWWTGLIYNSDQSMNMTLCCGDDQIEDGRPDGKPMIDFITDDSQLICWDSGRPYSNRYSSVIPPTGIEYNPDTSSNDQWYWASPNNIPYKVIGLGANNDIDWLAYNNRWHACTDESFLYKSDDVTNPNRWDIMGSYGDPILVHANSNPAYDLLCSNTDYSSGNLNKLEKPRIYECNRYGTTYAFRSFFNYQQQYAWGLTAGLRDMHFYGKDESVQAEFIPGEIFAPQAMTTDVLANFTHIDAMTYVDSSQMCDNCLVVIVGHQVYTIKGDEIDAHALGSNGYFYPMGFNIASISSVQYLPFQDSPGFFGTLDDGGYKYFMSDPDSTISSLAVKESPWDTTINLRSCSELEYPPANTVRSMFYLNPGEHGVEYPTLIINTNSGTSYVYMHDGINCTLHKTSMGFNLNRDTNADSLTQSGQLYPDATAYLPPSEHQLIGVPDYLGTTLVSDSRYNKIFLLMNPPIFCKGTTGWDTDLDTVDSDDTCDQYYPEQWTGTKCCGEGEDPFESYLDTDKICFKGHAFSVGQTINDRFINRGETKFSELKELRLKYASGTSNPQVYSCAIDTQQACQKLNLLARTQNNYGTCDVNRQDNKPYEGSSNLLDGGDNGRGWRNIGGTSYGNDWDSCALVSRDGSDFGCRMMTFDESAQFPTMVYHKLNKIKPSTTYHFSVWLNYNGYLSDNQMVSIEYRVNGDSRQSKEFQLIPGWSEYILVFTSSSNSAEYDFSQYSHTINISINSLSTQLTNSPYGTARTVYVDDARLASNDYLLSIKNYPDPHHGSDQGYSQAQPILGSTSDPKQLTYCQTMDDNSDNRPDYYCGFDEVFHSISDEAQDRFNFQGANVNILKEKIASSDPNGRLRLKYINWSSFLPYFPKSTQIAGCCLKYQCWNGSTCVEPLTVSRPILYPNRSIEYMQQARPGMICQNRTTGAVWHEVSAKWTWDNTDFGYCPYDSQCMVDVNGNFSHNNHPEDFSPYEKAGLSQTHMNPICIDDGQFIGDHYCDNGNWTTRTRLLADTLMQFTPDDFSLACGNYSDVLNIFDFDVQKINAYAPENGGSYRGCQTDALGRAIYHNVADTYFANNFESDQYGSCVIRECAYRDYGATDIRDYSMPCINDFCVLKDNSGHVVMGFSVNSANGLGGDHYPISNLFDFHNDVNFCSNANPNNDVYTLCYETNLGPIYVYYNAKKKIVIFTKSSLLTNNGPGDDFSSIKERMKDVFWSMNGYGAIQLPNEANISNDFNTFYFSKSGGKKVFGTTFETGIRNLGNGNGIFKDMFIEYEGINNSVCQALDKKTTMMEKSFYLCNDESEDNRIASQSIDGNYMWKYWNSLTSELRIFR